MRILEWQSSFFIRSSYFWFVFIPIWVKALSKVDSTLSIPVPGKTITLHLSLPFTWWLFFFSAVAFAIGKIVYQVRCPMFIRRYPTYEAYVKGGSSQVVLLQVFLSAVRQLFPETGGAVKDSFVKAVGNLSGGNVQTNVRFIEGHDAQVNPQKLADAYYIVQQLVAREHPASRLVCAMAINVGSALFMWTCVEAVWFVVSFLIFEPPHRSLASWLLTPIS